MVETLSLRDKLKVSTPAELAGNKLTMLVFGDPGSGKTLLAGTALDVPAMAEVLFLSTEAGLKTLVKNYPHADAKEIRQIKQLETIWNLLDKERGLYNTVVIDSLGELQKVDMIDIMEAAWKKNPANTDKEVPSQREWGKSQVHIRDIVREYRDLGLNVIFTCHSKVETNEKTGKTRILPSLPGKLAAEIAGFVDVVGNLEVELARVEETPGKVTRKAVRILRVQSDGISIVKDRTQTLGDRIIEPTIPKIWELIHNG